MNFSTISKTAHFLVFAVVLILLTFSCSQKTTTPAVAVPAPAAPAPVVQLPAVDPEILKKIKFDISKIDENGLRGPVDGKTSVSYEFCILSWQTSWDTVQKIDPTLKMPGGPCRIACPRNYWCVFGSTSGKGWRERLINIAKLEEVKEIQETVWE